MINYAIIFWVSIILSLIFLLISKSIFYKLNLLDKPEKYWYKRNPIPYWVWIIFFPVFFISTYLFIDYSYKLLLIWIFWAIVTIISFIDDRLEVSAKIRLLIQIMIWAVIWLTSIKIWYISNIFWWIINLETYHIEFFSQSIFLIPLIFTIIWYVFIFNSLNWSDGIKWNTSGISIISFFILFLLASILIWEDDYPWALENSKFIIWICIILIWILLPFWYFDIKEKMLMWDSGTMFLAFMLATLAIIAGWKIATVLVVFGVYAIDAIYVIMTRLLAKKNPLKWDFTHLHHRLLDIWLSKKKILIIIYSMSFCFWLASLFLEKVWKIIIFIIIAFIVIYIDKILKQIIKNKIWKINEK